MFTSQGEAKRFFVEKIVTQAVTDGTPLSDLSDAERQMLSFSESDPEFVVSPALVEKLQAEISDEDYEAKVAGLLERSWKRDVESDCNARDVYREAFTVLSQGDHYLLVMINLRLVDNCARGGVLAVAPSDTRLYPTPTVRNDLSTGC